MDPTPEQANTAAGTPVPDPSSTVADPQDTEMAVDSTTSAAQPPQPTATESEAPPQQTEMNGVKNRDLEDGGATAAAGISKINYAQAAASGAVPPPPSTQQGQPQAQTLPSSTTTQQPAAPSSAAAPNSTPNAPTSTSFTPPPPQPTNTTAPTTTILPPKPASHGAPARRYLNEKVTPYLLEGVKMLARERPEEPLRVLGEWLVGRGREVEGKGGKGGG